MLKRTAGFLKYPILISAILISIISCEKEFVNVGDNLVDNNLFSTGKYVAQVKGYSTKIDANQTNNLEYSLLGYTANNDFGSLNASVITQLYLPGANPDFGDNAVIDSVLIVIPFISSQDGTQEVTDPSNTSNKINVPNFVLDSVYASNEKAKFHLNIYESGTYLNDLDPTNPYNSNVVMSDDVFIKTSNLFFSGDVFADRNDTISIINRYKYSDSSLSQRVLYDKDTITLTNKGPALKIPLNKSLIKQIFQDNASSGGFSSVENFNHYFRGLYFEASNFGADNLLMYLKMAGGYMAIYYTSSEITDEGKDEDLNGNGVNGESKVIKATSNSFTYWFSGNKVNLYTRDQAGSAVASYLSSPNKTEGEDKIFIHGAAGSDGVIHLFGDDTDSNGVPDELETLKNNTWLINDAKLFLYIDPSNTAKQYPEKLYLYSIDNAYKKQPYEVFAYYSIDNGLAYLGGNLVYDEDGNPEYYLFHLTKYVLELIKDSDKVKITDFGIKAFDPHDEALSTIDTIMRKYNNNFKGVIVTGNNSNAVNKLKFEIHYTQKNN